MSNRARTPSPAPESQLPRAPALAPGAVRQPNGAETLGRAWTVVINRRCSCGWPEYRRPTVWPGRARGRFDTRHELSGMLRALPGTGSGAPAGGHGELVFSCGRFRRPGCIYSAHKIEAAGFVTMNTPCRQDQRGGEAAGCGEDARTGRNHPVRGTHNDACSEPEGFQKDSARDPADLDAGIVDGRAGAPA